MNGSSAGEPAARVRRGGEEANPGTTAAADMITTKCRRLIGATGRERNTPRWTTPDRSLSARRRVGDHSSSRRRCSRAFISSPPTVQCPVTPIRERDPTGGAGPETEGSWNDHTLAPRRSTGAGSSLHLVGVGSASLALALMPGGRCRRPAGSAQPVHPRRRVRRSRRLGASCSGLGWRPSRPTRDRSARRDPRALARRPRRPPAPRRRPWHRGGVARARPLAPRRGRPAAAGRDYFFQFDAGGEESPVGHFRTAPARDQWATG